MYIFIKYAVMQQHHQ